MTFTPSSSPLGGSSPPIADLGCFPRGPRQRQRLGTAYLGREDDDVRAVEIKSDTSSSRFQATGRGRRWGYRRGVVVTVHGR